MAFDAEEVRKQVATLLASAEFTETLEEIYAEKGDTDPIDYPFEVHSSVQVSPQQFPCGEVQVDKGRNNAPDSMLVDLTYEVTIWWHQNGVTENLIDDQLGRLVRATQDFFKSRASFAPELNVSCWLGDDDYSPFYPSNNDLKPFMKSATQIIFVRGIR